MRTSLCTPNWSSYRVFLLPPFICPCPHQSLLYPWSVHRTHYFSLGKQCVQHALFTCSSTYSCWSSVLDLFPSIIRPTKTNNDKCSYWPCTIKLHIVRCPPTTTLCILHLHTKYRISTEQGKNMLSAYTLLWNSIPILLNITIILSLSLKQQPKTNGPMWLYPKRKRMLINEIFRMISLYSFETLEKYTIQQFDEFKSDSC